jgi:chaperonin cofactor prefoldin
MPALQKLPPSLSDGSVPSLGAFGMNIALHKAFRTMYRRRPPRGGVDGPSLTQGGTMNDARVDKIEEALNGLSHQVDGLSVQLYDSTDRLDGRIDELDARFASRLEEQDARLGGRIEELGTRLDGRIDALAVEVRTGFEDTKLAFEDHRRYSEFLTERLRDDMNLRFDEVDRRFNQVDRRFDSMDERFDRLERLIREQ